MLILFLYSNNKKTEWTIIETFEEDDFICIDFYGKILINLIKNIPTFIIFSFCIKNIYDYYSKFFISFFLERAKKGNNTRYVFNNN